MNPMPFLLWIVTGCLLALAPKLLLGWSWWWSLGMGMLAAPPFLWLVASALDRHERGEPAVQLPTPPPGTPPLVLEPAPACPKCGGAESARVLYGLPAFTDELKKAIEGKRVVLGGCPVYAGAPRFICTRCGERHGTAGPGSASGR